MRNAANYSEKYRRLVFCIGGKRKKDPNEEVGEPRKCGRGTAKDVVLGAVARGGKVVAELSENVKGSTIADFIKKFVKTEDAQLYTDPYRGYNEMNIKLQQLLLAERGINNPEYPHE